MPKILTDIGQCAVTYGGVSYILTPSFINIAQIGSPKEIIEVYKAVNDNYAFHQLSEFTSKSNATIFKMSSQYVSNMLNSSLDVVRACSDRNIPDELFGSFNDRCMFKYSFDGVPPVDLVNFARCLLHHGLIGDLDARGTSTDQGGSDGGFVASRFISFAESPYPRGFGLSRDSAERLTMTSFKIMYEDTFPEVKDAIKEKEDRDNDINNANDYYAGIREMRAALEAENG